MKQYVGISRDHSGSMGSLRRPATKDYNDTVKSLQEAAGSTGIDTIVSVTSCGIHSKVRREVVNSSVNALKPLTSYTADGGTPLFDSVGELIEIFEQVPDYLNKEVTFLIIAITDGEENQSRTWGIRKLSDKIRQLQATDKWTFVFRVPRGYRRNLESLGIPSGNIQEWDQTERGFKESTVQTQAAITNYYKGVTRGVTSSKSFYTDLSGVASNTVAAALTPITGLVSIHPVNRKSIIASFFPLITGQEYKRGTAFYELMKPEKAVQDYKIIVVQNKQTGEVFAGRAARQLLNLPEYGTISVRPKDHGQYRIYVQSTSTNRILPAGTSALYWPNPTN
jgi:hypothetical protein